MSLAAPDIRTLLDVETHVEIAFKRVLGAAGLRAYVQREEERMTVPCVLVQCSLGAQQAHVGFDRAGRPWRDAWAFSVSLEIRTRVKAEDHQTHGLYRATVRELLQYSADAFSEQVLPYHVLTQRAEAGTSPAIATEDDCHVSTLSVAGIVSIRSTAWPALPA